MGLVRLGTHTETGLQVALKIVHKDRSRAVKKCVIALLVYLDRPWQTINALDPPRWSGAQVASRDCHHEAAGSSARSQAV